MKQIFILGAGASKHLSYPLGSELLNDILAITSKERKVSHLNPFYQFLTIENPTREKRPVKYYDFLCIVCKTIGINSTSINNFYNNLDGCINISPSIDIFLSNLHSEELRKIGKIAIAISILKRESQTHFSNPGWYKYFIGPYYPSRGGIFDFRNIEIITFNYDRSFDWFIQKTIKNHYKLNLSQLDPEQTKEMIDKSINSFKIHHVYGIVEAFKDNVEDNYGNFSEFLLSIQFDNNREKAISLVLAASENIKTIYELNSDNFNYDYYQLLSNNNALNILGFGFHELNFEIMGISHKLNQFIQAKRIYSTAFGLSEIRKSNFADLVGSKYDVGFVLKFGEWNKDVNNFFIKNLA